MKYKDLIETLRIVAKYDGGLDNECYKFWGTHDEIGIEFGHYWNVSAKDIRRLAEMGWSLGCDGNYDENNEAFEKWENYKDLSDDELVSIFNEFKTISIFV